MSRWEEFPVMVIEGWLNDLLQPRLLLELRSLEDRFAALIDTGFNGEVLLPLELALGAAASLEGAVRYTLADGASKSGFFYHDRLQWFNEFRHVRVVTWTGVEPTIGLRLLRECVLEINFPARTVKLSG